jgi:hypothetical protein
MAFLSGPIFPTTVGMTGGNSMGPAAIAAIKYGVPIASAILGGMGGKSRDRDSRNPIKTVSNSTQQRTPWDFNPELEGNQGAEMLASILSGWGGLLGGLGPSQEYEQSVKRGLGQFLA